MCRLESLADSEDLIDGLPFREYDLRLALTEGSVMIERGESQLLSRKVGQLIQCRIGCNRPSGYFSEQGFEPGAIHAA